MEKHPKAGQPVKIANGPLKGKYFVISDWYVNQYQGKSIDKLRKTKWDHLEPVHRRKYPIDSRIVWGRLYPAMDWCCVHDDELRVDMKVVENDDGTSEELPPNVEAMTGKKSRKGKGGK